MACCSSLWMIVKRTSHVAVLESLNSILFILAPIEPICLFFESTLLEFLSEKDYIMLLTFDSSHGVIRMSLQINLFVHPCPKSRYFYYVKTFGSKSTISLPLNVALIFINCNPILSSSFIRF